MAGADPRGGVRKSQSARPTTPPGDRLARADQAPPGDQAPPANRLAPGDQPPPGDQQPPGEEVLADAADTFAMLASSQRLHLLWLLARQERDVSTLAAALGASVPLVSQHLGKLRLAGLVSARRQGKRQLYRVDDPHVVSLVDQAIDHHEDLRARARVSKAG